MMTPAPMPSLTTDPPFDDDTAEPSPPRIVVPEIRPLPSHLAGETFTPGTDWREEEAVWTTALSALEANTSIEGTANRGIGGISPGRYPGTASADEAVADWVGVGVVASSVGEAEGVRGLEEPQAPRVRAAAAIMTEAVRVCRVMFMPPTVRENKEGR